MLSDRPPCQPVLDVFHPDPLSALGGPAVCSRRATCLPCIRGLLCLPASCCVQSIKSNSRRPEGGVRLDHCGAGDPSPENKLILEGSLHSTKLQCQGILRAIHFNKSLGGSEDGVYRMFLLGPDLSYVCKSTWYRKNSNS